jgi:uncharacterized protein YycO
MADIALPAVRRLLLEAATPALRAMSFHTPPHYRYLSKSSRTRTLMNMMRPGDALVSRRNHELTNLIIPGFWKHAAKYVGNGRVVEAIGRGVIETSLEEFMTTKDAVCVRRGRWSEVLAIHSAEEALKMRGRKYDYLVEPNGSDWGGRRVNDAFYCSEVVWASDQAAHAWAGLVSPFEPRLTMGVMTITPTDIALADRCYETIGEICG